MFLTGSKKVIPLFPTISPPSSLNIFLFSLFKYIHGPPLSKAYFTHIKPQSSLNSAILLGSLTIVG